jgi:NADH-quinone oxidoreductase subunit N
MKSLLLLSGLGIGAMLAELFNFKKLLFPLVCLGLLAAIGVSVYDWNTDIRLFNNMLRLDNYALVFTASMSFITLLWLLGANDYIEHETHVSDKYALTLFTLVGAFVMVSYNNLTMLFIGIEILSLSMYVLAGSKKNDLFSNEAALKYFLMGSFATGFLLFGVALIYGVTGSFHVEAIGDYCRANAGNLPMMFIAAIVLMMIGMAFKVSATPFHFWAPDVYTGAPSMVTAYMATVVKTAAVVAFARLFYNAFGHAPAVWQISISVMAVLTMFVGNVTAVFQQNVKRMLAYSSVAHAGYLLIALVAMSKLSGGAIFYYTLSYSLASLLAFHILFTVSGNKNEGADISAFNGLAKRNPLMAFGITVAMLSLAGIPPLAGFFGKYYIFNAAIEAGRYKLVILAVIASLISVYYYFKVIIAVYFKQSNEAAIELNGMHKLLYLICVILLFVLAIIPELIISMLK